MDKTINDLIKSKDKDIAEYLDKELKRQNNGLELIASENYPSKEVRAAMASIATAKYAEGYPEKRYYGGCKYIDEIEKLAIKRACRLFKCKYANVQPHSGSQANAAAYRALEVMLTKEGKLQPGEKMRVLAMQLNDGGHLTHGSPVSFSSHQYDFSFFPLTEDGYICFDLVEKAIIEHKPHVLLLGWSAYPHELEFQAYASLAKKYDLKYMVDMAHIAGLVAAGRHSNPCLYADIVTTTTHKTLRGPRGGLILTNNADLIKYVNSAVFPYYQGGPLEHVIAAKAICFNEALNPSFKNYIERLTDNMTFLAMMLSNRNRKVFGLGLTHMILLDVKSSYGITGLGAQNKLEEIGITVNKNMIPNDTEKPSTASGIRIGFAALTTRGLNTVEAQEIAYIIDCCLSNKLTTKELKNRVKSVVSKLKPVEEI